MKDYAEHGNRKHGEAKSGTKQPSSEYTAWDRMIQRCENPKHHAYHNYGGRGISICKKWRNSYEAFLADVGRRPSSKHSLDRIKNNQGYKPSNVRWATAKQQQRNTRTNRVLKFRDKALCVSEWAERLGTTKLVILNRLRLGWSIERTLTEPVAKRKRRST